MSVARKPYISSVCRFKQGCIVLSPSRRTKCYGQCANGSYPYCPTPTPLNTTSPHNCHLQQLTTSPGTTLWQSSTITVTWINMHRQQPFYGKVTIHPGFAGRVPIFKGVSRKKPQFSRGRPFVPFWLAVLDLSRPVHLCSHKLTHQWPKID